MANDNKKEVIELCGRVAKEQDPPTLLRLIAELSHVLEVQEQHLKAQAHTSKPAPSLPANERLPVDAEPS